MRVLLSSPHVGDANAVPGCLGGGAERHEGREDPAACQELDCASACGQSQVGVPEPDHGRVEARVLIALPGAHPHPAGLSRGAVGRARFFNTQRTALHSARSAIAGGCPGQEQPPWIFLTTFLGRVECPFASAIILASWTRASERKRSVSFSAAVATEATGS